MLMPEARGRPQADLFTRSEASLSDGRVRMPVVFLALIAFAAVVRAGVVLNTALDPDESQHLHTAWLVGEGQRPFADFWEHHTPLLHYLLAPLTWWWSDSPAVYYAARVVMTLFAAVALLLLYRLVRRLSATAAMASVVLLAVLPRFVENTTEVRPDVPGLAVWIGSLTALAIWRESGRAAWLSVAGLALGVWGLLTPKAVYGALGVAAAVLAAGLGRGGPGLGPALVSLARLAAGAAAPLVLFLIGLGLAGGTRMLGGFVDQVVVQNLTFADFDWAWPVGEEGLGFLLLALAGVVLVVRRDGRAVLRHPVHGSLLVPGLALTLVLLAPSTPAVYRHTWLPLLAVAAVYAGVALAALLERGGAPVGRWRPLLLGGALLVALVVPAGESVREALRDRIQVQLRIMRLQLLHACQGEPVLDGNALYVFRPAAYRYRVLINGVRYWIANAVIPEEQILEDLARARARVGYADARLRALVGPVATFLARHYVMTPEGLLLAGALIPVPGGAEGGRAWVELLAAGAYRLSASPGIAVEIDRTRVSSPLVRLGAGRHEVTWTGPAGAIRIAAATCLERRVVEGDGVGGVSPEPGRGGPAPRA